MPVPELSNVQQITLYPCMTICSPTRAFQRQNGPRVVVDFTRTWWSIERHGVRAKLSTHHSLTTCKFDCAHPFAPSTEIISSRRERLGTEFVGVRIGDTRRVEDFNTVTIDDDDDDETEQLVWKQNAQQKPLSLLLYDIHRLPPKTRVLHVCEYT